MPSLRPALLPAIVDYKKAKLLARQRGIDSPVAWAELVCEQPLPTKVLPANPAEAYGQEWSGWQEFLGASTPRSGIPFKGSGKEISGVARLRGLRKRQDLLPYSQARAAVAELGLQSAQDFRIWAKSGQRPDNVPLHPAFTYKGPTWKGWSDFLGLKLRRGAGLVTTRNVLSLTAARKIVEHLTLNSPDDYFLLVKAGALPTGLPAHPDEHYQLDGWTTWAHFLGSTEGALDSPVNVADSRPDGLLPFADARALAQAQGLANAGAWFKFASSARRPVYIPKEPWKVYFQDGYRSLEDFIGAPELVCSLA